ncbi:MAG TPA: sugar ABC transporter ATP-binding protein [Solirubrobacteraceae bacterium]|nr:sugar ABC transporter ATP-binding protein [Solirubrobacteraceae bacterium]
MALAATGQALLEVRGLTRSFPGVRALDRVTFDVHPREVVALVGQNGSGKSTLVKVLAGVLAADAGSVRVRGADGSLLAGADALERLHFIHQDLGLIPTLSTVENLDLGRRLGARALAPIRPRAERRAVSELITPFGGSFDVGAPVAALTAAQQRIVAISRALAGWRHADNLLVLDEPTAALPAGEAQRLFEAVRRVARGGAGVIFISHRLDEVLELADRILVLRDGRLVADAPAGEVGHEQLVRLVAGGAPPAVRAPARASARPPARVRAAEPLPPARLRPDEPLPPARVRPAEPALRVRPAEPVLAAHELAGAGVVGLSLEILPGEIVGVGGLVGSGHEQVADLLFGAARRSGGRVHVAGEPLPVGDPRAAIRRGVAFVPADRHGAAAVMEMCARENLTLPWLAPHRRRLGRIDLAHERSEARGWAERVGLSPPDPDRTLRLFSGGNQQKVILARWLRMRPRVLLLEEPTQGVDVGAKAAIHSLICDAAEAGAAVLVSSSDAKELALLCGRVLVMRAGRVADELHAGQRVDEPHAGQRVDEPHAGQRADEPPAGQRAGGLNAGTLTEAGLVRASLGLQGVGDSGRAAAQPPAGAGMRPADEGR